MPKAQQAQHDRRAIAALFAVFALLIQALFPAAAMAASPSGDASSIICTAAGMQSLGPDGKLHSPQKGSDGMPCQDCLAAAMTAVAAAPTPVVQPVTYEIARVEHAPVRAVFAPRARAPPRPPGQGPPTA
jgi:hypothetical protein